jgi:hypothetical protein
MKTVLRAAAGFAVAIAIASSAQAGHFIVIPHGTNSGPVTVNNPTTPVTTGVVNHGTITGGSSPGITVTGPIPVTIVNTGTITSNTTGILVTGSSSTVKNTGSIIVTSSGTSNASAVGISMTGGGTVH